MAFKQIREVTIRQPVSVASADMASGEVIAFVKYPDTNIDFTVFGVEGTKSDITKVKIYGVSRGSFQFFDKYLEDGKVFPIELKAGYEDSLSGYVYEGIIKDLSYEWNSGTPYMEIVCNHNVPKIRTVINKSFSPGSTTDLRTVIKGIVSEAGYSTRNVVIPDKCNVSFAKKGYKAEGELREILTQLCFDNDLYFGFDRERVYVYPNPAEIVQMQKIDKESGLITEPRETNKKQFEFETFLNPSVRVGHGFSIDYDGNGAVTMQGEGVTTELYRVVQYTHKADGSNDFKTYCLCEKTSHDEEEKQKIFERFYKDDKGK